MEFPVDHKNFINIALLIRKWCYTDQELSVGDMVEFTNRDMGGHCKVKVTGVQDGKMEWTVENLYYINPSFQADEPVHPA